MQLLSCQLHGPSHISEEYYNLPNVNRRSESRNTVATQTSPLRDTDDDIAEGEAQTEQPLSVGQLTLERSVDDRKLQLENAEDLDDVPHTPSAPLPPASIGSRDSRAGLESLSPTTPISSSAFDTGRSSRKRSVIPFSLNDQYLSAPYIDDGTGSIVLGNGSIEQGDVSL